MGVFSWKPNHRDDLAYLGRMLEVGQLRPVIDGVFGLSEVPEALARLQRGQARGKIVITI
jgi:NADPH:quinone reductase-like Zn-dependent oxidoreductase